MGLLVYKPSQYKDTAENEEFRKLTEDLRDYYASRDELCLFIANYDASTSFEKCELDALIITQNAIISVEFKNFGGTILATSDHYHNWLAMDTIGKKVVIKGGSQRNPLDQAARNRNMLHKNLSCLLTSKQLKYIPVLIVFHQPITLGQSLEPKVSSWLHIVDESHFRQKIVDMATKGCFSLSADGFLTLVQRLNLLQSDLFEQYSSPDLVDRLYEIDIMKKVRVPKETPKVSSDVDAHSALVKQEIEHSLPKVDLTSDQQKAFEGFASFLHTDIQIFMLKGSAGTGKTTLLRQLIDSLPTQSNNKEDNYSYCLMAPTGRAAHILSEKTGHPAATIHRTIYQIAKVDDQGGKLCFDLRCNDDSANTVYFVDEASMVSDINSDSDTLGFGSGYLLRDLMRFCGKRKIVFVGDYAQLPPVGQNVSPAFDADYLLRTYDVKACEVMLSQVVRQGEHSGIYANAKRIRDAIEENDFSEFALTNGEDVVASEQLLSDYGSVTDCKVDKDAIVLVFSNMLALQYNLQIRSQLFHNPQVLMPGDLLLVSRNNYSYGIELFNGTVVKVLACDADNEVEVRHVHFYTGNKDEKGENETQEVDLRFREVTIEVEEHNVLIPWNVVVLDNFLDNPSGALPKYLSQALIADFRNRMRANNISSSSEQYHNLIRTDPYLNALICKYGYSITCHKAQGGEWKRVFVNLDRPGGHQNSEYFRWVYTAITRSASKLWYFNAPCFDAVSNLLVSPIQRGGDMVYADTDFMNLCFKRMCGLCKSLSISCTDDRTKQYQHLITFCGTDNCQCTLQLWYGKKGYNGKVGVLHSTNDEFAQQMLRLCRRSAMVGEFVFRAGNQTSQKLYDYVKPIAEELQLTIVNIVQEPYKDTYYLLTDAVASSVAFAYNSKGMFTRAFPQSTDGESDALLVQFCAKLK
jgi:hypothetical protein